MQCNCLKNNCEGKLKTTTTVEKQKKKRKQVEPAYFSFFSRGNSQDCKHSHTYTLAILSGNLNFLLKFKKIEFTLLERAVLLFTLGSFLLFSTRSSLNTTVPSLRSLAKHTTRTFSTYHLSIRTDLSAERVGRVCKELQKVKKKR
jgi:hypothetical protein